MHKYPVPKMQKMYIGYLHKQGITFSSDFMTVFVRALLNIYDQLSLFFSHFIMQWIFSGFSVFLFYCKYGI